MCRSRGEVRDLIDANEHRLATLALVHAHGDGGLCSGHAGTESGAGAAEPCGDLATRDGGFATCFGNLGHDGEQGLLASAVRAGDPDATPSSNRKTEVVEPMDNLGGTCAATDRSSETLAQFFDGIWAAVSNPYSNEFEGLHGQRAHRVRARPKDPDSARHIDRGPLRRSNHAVKAESLDEQKCESPRVLWRKRGDL